MDLTHDIGPSPTTQLQDQAFVDAILQGKKPPKAPPKKSPAAAHLPQPSPFAAGAFPPFMLPGLNASSYWIPGISIPALHQGLTPLQQQHHQQQQQQQWQQQQQKQQATPLPGRSSPLVGTPPGAASSPVKRPSKELVDLVEPRSGTHVQEAGRCIKV